MPKIDLQLSIDDLDQEDIDTAFGWHLYRMVRNIKPDILNNLRLAIETKLKYEGYDFKKGDV